MSQELSANTQLAHYRIVAHLGAGGMGEVYLAEDAKLGRRVALKVLPESLAQDNDRLRRFEQEAQAASALNHPNILTIYEIGETDRKHFIATEYIEGETLRHHIQHTRLKLREVLDIAVQVASALSTAHQAGIIHRDIKPENLMLRPDGIVKVLDFGLAKLSEKPAPVTDSAAPTISRKATDPGTIMGTVQYMSPEQARGQQVDVRSDIFSLGVVLFEMVAGRPPFTGESSSDVLAAILEREPPPLARFTDEVPQELQRIVSKMLRKDRDERYQTMKDVLLDLRELRDELTLEAKLERSTRLMSNFENQPTLIGGGGITHEAGQQTDSAARAPTTSSAEYLVSEIKQHRRGIAVVALILLFAAIGAGIWFFLLRSAPAKPIESIAVMPFVNESGNADVEYLSDGMTETLIGSLSQLTNLRVKARSSVFRYKGKETDAKTIGKELGVQAVLNGRVTQHSDQISLLLELVDARTEDVIWSDKYDRKQNNLITLQSEIARDVSSKLKFRLSGAEAAKVAKNYTINAEAYQLYLKGRFFTRQYSLDGFKKSVEAYGRAIALDPNYALAYAGLSDAYFTASTVHIPPAEALPKVGEYARKALELDDSLAAAHHSLANFKSNYEHDFAASEHEFIRSIELGPNEPLTYYDYAWTSATIGEFDRAIALADRGRQIDPLAVDMASLSGGMYALAGRTDEAIVQLQDALKLDDKSWWVLHWMGVVYYQKGMFDRSLESFQAAAKLDNSLLIQGYIAHVLGRAGRKSDAQRIINELVETSKRRYVPASAFVLGYSGLGDMENAFAWIEKGYASHDEWLLGLKVYPMFATLRGDPRYQEMLKRLNLPE